MKGNFIGKKPIYQSGRNRSGSWEIYDQSQLKAENNWFSSVDTVFDASVDYWPTGQFIANSISTPTYNCGGSISADGKYLYVVYRASTTAPFLYIYNLLVPWKIGTAWYTKRSVYLSALGTSGTGVYISDDGNKLFGINGTTDTIEQYSASLNGNIETLKYDNKSFSVAAQDTSPAGLTFKPDGTKCYVVASLTDTVYQYSLSTAWDISTASYDSKSKSVPEDTVPTGITFKPDGTIFYVSGSTGDEVNQYTCSTAWDVSTASFEKTTSFAVYFDTLSQPYLSPDGNTLYLFGNFAPTTYSNSSEGVREFTLTTAWDTGSFYLKGEGGGDLSIRNQGSQAIQISFKDDGTKLYYLSLSNDTIYQYSLSTAWNINTASYDSKSFLITQDSAPYGLFFKSDGTKFYVAGDTTNAIYQYSCSTAWDISTASYDSKSFSVNTQDSGARNIFLKPDGTKFYLLGSTNDRVYQYSLSTAWDISTATYDNISYLITSQESIPIGLTFKSDGTKFYIIGNNKDTIYQYSLSTAWDISTASLETESIDLLEFGSGAGYGLFFTPDGTRLFVGNIGSIAQYECRMAWDVGSLVQNYPNIMFHSVRENTYGLHVNEEGTFLYAALEDVYNTARVATYKFLEPHNLNTVIFTSQAAASISPLTGVPVSAYWRADGQKLYMMSGFTGSAVVYEYNLRTPWEMHTLSYASKSFNTGTQGTIGLGFTFKHDGTKLYVCLDSVTDTVYQYSLSTAWDVTTATYDNKSLSSFKVNAMRFNDDGTKLMAGVYGASEWRLYTLSTAWDISTATLTSEIDLDFDGSSNAYYAQFPAYNGKLLYAATPLSDAIIKMARE